MANMTIESRESMLSAHLDDDDDDDFDTYIYKVNFKLNF